MWVHYEPNSDSLNTMAVTDLLRRRLATSRSRRRNGRLVRGPSRLAPTTRSRRPVQRSRPRRASTDTQHEELVTVELRVRMPDVHFVLALVPHPMSSTRVRGSTSGTSPGARRVLAVVPGPCRGSPLNSSKNSAVARSGAMAPIVAGLSVTAGRFSPRGTRRQSRYAVHRPPQDIACLPRGYRHERCPQRSSGAPSPMPPIDS